MSSAKNSLSNLATKLALYPIGFVSSVWISRYLGPEDKGIYVYILLLSSYFLPIFSLGIGAGFRYYVSNKKYKIEDITYTVLLISIVIGFLVGGLIYLGWTLEILGNAAKDITLSQVIILGVVMIFGSIYFFTSRIALGNSQFHLNNSIQVLKNILNPILMILLVYALALRIDGVMWALLILHITVAMSLLFAMISKNGFVNQFNKAFLKDAFGYGLKGWIGDMAVKANVRLDQLILGGVASTASLGIYSVGVLLAEMLWIIPDSIGSVLFNRIAQHEENKSRIELTTKMHRLIFAISSCIAVVWVIICIYLIIPYGYGEDYLGSILPLLILAPGALFLLPAKVLSKLMSGAGRISDTTRSTFYGSLFSILLYFLLIPGYGIVGAAVASSIGYLGVSVLSFYYSSKNFDLGLSDLFLLTWSDIEWAKNQIFSIVK